VRQGTTSHAAVVARGWGKPCVCGVKGLVVSESARSVQVKSHGHQLTFAEGDWLSINGHTGQIFKGQLEVRWVVYTPTWC